MSKDVIFFKSETSSRLITRVASINNS